jgi:hypothetical protein
MKRYFSLNAFYRAYEKTEAHITLTDIDRLEERLRAEGFSVRELKNDSVIVRSPDELKAAAQKRRESMRRGADKHTKPGASVPKETAKAFAEACRILGVSQSGTLMPPVAETIRRAGL